MTEVRSYPKEVPSGPGDNRPNEVSTSFTIRTELQGGFRVPSEIDPVGTWVISVSETNKNTRGDPVGLDFV